MKVVKGFPPNFKELHQRFNLRNKPVIFAWGELIYNPTGVIVTPELKAHEEVHGSRQFAIGIEPWWDRYLEDIQFRFHEELLAHQVEWHMRCQLVGEDEVYLRAMAERLAGPLYGNICSIRDARELIQK